MKKLLFPIIIMLLAVHAYGQKAPYNVVFDVTSSDTTVHRMVIRLVNEITKADPNANIEVVYYGKSLDMITQGKSTVADNVMSLAAMPHVNFNVCEVAMKNNKVDRSQLVHGVGTVPDGIYEIVSKQHDGWGYIKVAK
ncbi:MAG: hypothetical protein ABJC12_03400 [Saprospiraceae bacterium]